MAFRIGIGCLVFSVSLALPAVASAQIDLSGSVGDASPTKMSQSSKFAATSCVIDPPRLGNAP
jgi:hypothetical protein